MSSAAPCVVLVSGGLDSATLLALMRAEGRPLYALSFDYGQRHREELVAAGRQCAAQGVRQHLVVPLDLRSIGGSALTSAAFDVPKDRTDDQMTRGIPVTYVPARNTVFLSIALGWADSVGCHDLVIGVNALDQGGYPDCRPPFIEAFERLAQVATRSGVEGSGRWRVHAPLIRLTKAEIIRQGTELGVDFSLTHSCYDPVAGGLACGRCDACQLRLAGFAAAGLVDPVPYAPR